MACQCPYCSPLSAVACVDEINVGQVKFSVYTTLQFEMDAPKKKL